MALPDFHGVFEAFVQALEAMKAAIEAGDEELADAAHWTADVLAAQVITRSMSLWGVSEKEKQDP